MHANSTMKGNLQNEWLQEHNVYIVTTDVDTTILEYSVIRWNVDQPRIGRFLVDVAAFGARYLLLTLSVNILGKNAMSLRSSYFHTSSVAPWKYSESSEENPGLSNYMTFILVIRKRLWDLRLPSTKSLKMCSRSLEASCKSIPANSDTSTWRWGNLVHTLQLIVEQQHQIPVT